MVEGGRNQRRQMTESQKGSKDVVFSRQNKIATRLSGYYFIAVLTAKPAKPNLIVFFLFGT